MLQIVGEQFVGNLLGRDLTKRYYHVGLWEIWVLMDLDPCKELKLGFQF